MKRKSISSKNKRKRRKRQKKAFLRRAVKRLLQGEMNIQQYDWSVYYLGHGNIEYEEIKEQRL